MDGIGTATQGFGDARARDAFVDSVLAELGPGRLQLSVEDARALISAFLAQTETSRLADPSRVAHLVMAHFELGRTRAPGCDLLSITVPSTEGGDASGSTFVLIVTEDRPFLVDTVTMELTGRDWSIRNLYHPQYVARRDADGVLTGISVPGVGAAGSPESWIAVEAYGPLGASVDAETAVLRDAIGRGLDAARRAVADWQDMKVHLEACVEKLDETAQPVSPRDVRHSMELLRWLDDDHFVLLGYREYGVRDEVFAPVAGTGLGILRGDVDAPDTFHAVPGPGSHEVLVMTKDSRRSPVHRRAYLDYVGVRVHDAAGRLVGEHRFLGLLSASAYSDGVTRIPLLAAKAAQLMERSGFGLESHAGHALAQVIATYPRDELFEASVDELSGIVDTVAALQERRQVRLFVRPGTYGRFLSCLVYLPRDRYNTATRLRVQSVLMRSLGGESLEYQASVSESALARLFFVIKLPAGTPIPQYDVVALEAELDESTRHWEDGFADAAIDMPSSQRGVEFGDAYQAAYTPRQALADLKLANELGSNNELRFALYAPDDVGDPADLRFKIITLTKMSLTKVMPHLSALGVDVLDERPFEWILRGDPVFVYDFGFKLPAGQTLADWTFEDRARFAEAFDASWAGSSYAGQLNRLVMLAGLTWRQVSWIRGLSRYLQQAGIRFSQVYVSRALTGNPGIARLLVDAFEARFDPANGLDPAARAAVFDARTAEAETMLEGVRSLDQDRIIRMFLAVLRAVVRTNAFAKDAPALAFKLAPRDLAVLPEPRPSREVFVASPRVEGVHMRFGAVARGGLRWSDRREDFRTEVLGLAKAQMVKNTVIVPVGAKGGFVPQHLPNPAVDRQGWLDEGVECYRLFVGAMLSVTDNIVGGQVVGPADVIRWDGDDPYLVVAADKGTATFSDFANAISKERGFWLGDAFASGGSVGFDHKAMGITAKGAWVSVRRHFFEFGVDCQSQDFTCVGIGDMAGDVFGNGMLQSPRTRLVAAFNHAHIFLDPDPDAAASFAERQRLFSLPRSSWTDYDRSLISGGGGVYERSAKAIPVTPEVRRVLGIASSSPTLTPTELISAILRAPVDLLWNGGIGTYVKASDETHADVGDKANDAVRVNGADVRARVAGEGGNLGWTQRGRIEYATAGGRINTDFIDNSAGVDTSDHEVNIKILLSPAIERGELAPIARNELLASMTDEVSRLVLQHNVDSTRALSDADAGAPLLVGAHEAWMADLEASGHLDRFLEALPDTSEMQKRAKSGRGLTRPELASLFAWTKIRLVELMLASDLPDDAYLADRLVTYFPKALRDGYAADMANHRLRREIVTTVTVNRFVNSMGITAYHRLAGETGADLGRIVAAQLAARTILAVARTELAVAGSAGVSARVDVGVRRGLQGQVERATRWLLRNRRGGLDITAEASRFTEPVSVVVKALPELLTPRQVERFAHVAGEYAEGGLDEALAARAAAADFADAALPIAQAAADTGQDPLTAAKVWFALTARLGLDATAERIGALPQLDHWDALARAALRDDLGALHELLAHAVLGVTGADAEASVDQWLASRPGVEADLATLQQVSGNGPDLARLSVALRTIRGLLG